MPANENSGGGLVAPGDKTLEEFAIASRVIRGERAQVLNDLVYLPGGHVVYHYAWGGRLYNTARGTVL